MIEKESVFFILRSVYQDLQCRNSAPERNGGRHGKGTGRTNQNRAGDRSRQRNHVRACDGRSGSGHIPEAGLEPQVDYQSSAIGIMNMTPPESAVIASDIAVKSGDVYLGFADRFTGTLIITGEISDVMSAMTEIVNYFRDELGYVVCKITKR